MIWRDDREKNSAKICKCAFTQPWIIVRISAGVNDLSKISVEAKLKLQRIFLTFLSDESGATAIEYGLIAAGISLAIIAVVNGLGTNLNTKFTDINNSLK